MTEKKDLGKTSLGIDANIAAFIAYAFIWISGLVILLLENDNKFVRFHALQSIILFGALSLFNFALAFIFPFAIPLVMLLGLALWIVLLIKAYQGELYKLPVVGDLAEKHC